MNHKDLLDSVINNMTSKEADTTEIPMDVESSADNSIRLELCTGETFLIDPSNFDWNAAAANLHHLYENEASFKNIAFELMLSAGEDTDETKKFIEHIIEQFTDYLAGYQITVDYKSFNDKLTDREIAMLMLFDVNNITKTMSHNISLYSAFSMLSIGNDGNMSINDEEESNDESYEYDYMAQSSGLIEE